MIEGSPTAGFILDDTYRLDSEIGVGGMADVYRAWHLRLKAHVAVKVLRAVPLTPQAPGEPVTPYPDGKPVPTPGSGLDLVQRFQREGEVLFGIQHPNIVQLYDLRQTADGRWYMVMEYLEGVDLAHAMQRESKIPLARVADLTGQIAAALGAIHSRGIVHRDLTPSNIRLIQPAGETRQWVKLLDFGLARFEGGPGMTRAGFILGTPEYMAPEQAIALPDQVDHRADEFALAAIAYEMLVGSRPFPRPPGDQGALAETIRTRRPLPLSEHGSDVPPGVAAVIMKGLRHDPNERYPDVRAFSQALVAAAAEFAGEPSGVKPATAILPDQGQAAAGVGEGRSILREGIAPSDEEGQGYAVPGGRRSGRNLLWFWIALVELLLVLAAALALRPWSHKEPPSPPRPPVHETVQPTPIPVTPSVPPKAEPALPAVPEVKEPPAAPPPPKAAPKKSPAKKAPERRVEEL